MVGFSVVLWVPLRPGSEGDLDSVPAQRFVSGGTLGQSYTNEFNTVPGRGSEEISVNETLAHPTFCTRNMQITPVCSSPSAHDPFAGQQAPACAL